MYLIDHDELPALGSEKGIRIIQPATIGGPLQVQIYRVTHRIGHDASRERRPTNLTRAEEHHAGFGAKSILDHRLQATGYHNGRKLNVTR